MNLVSSLIGCFLMMMGFACLLIKANSVEYIDSQGFLHENFYLLPVGFLLMSAGLIVIAAAYGTYLVRKHREKEMKKE